jgi:hypothetical protein
MALLLRIRSGKQHNRRKAKGARQPIRQKDGGEGGGGAYFSPSNLRRYRLEKNCTYRRLAELIGSGITHGTVFNAVHGVPMSERIAFLIGKFLTEVGYGG